jgi:serine/threonine protein kinase
MTLGAALTEGYVVSDRFQLIRLLGRGGMGSVWVARHLSLNIEVAIKFIDGVLGGREDLRSRFAQEARTAARIQSPHVVNILDYGFDGTRPFIAMELLHGEPLFARIERERRLPPSEVATILTQAAKGLGRAHSLGIVHRDLKPENLFLARDEDGQLHVKLLDFGIARDDSPLGSGPSHRTGTGQLLGTPAYMSPEQALGKSQIDFRSDLYSLAVVVYHCLAGRLPFDTDAIGELIVAISLTDPPLPSSFVPGLSPGIDAWFKCAFQKDPGARFGSAKEMAETFVVACRDSSSAYDRTVLAATTDGGASGRDVARPQSVAPTKHSPGVILAGTPAPTASWSLAGPVPVDRGSGPVGARSGPGQTAPWSGAGISTAPPAPRIPDTFVGQSATQGGGVPGLPTRGPSLVLLGLVGLIALALVVAGVLFVGASRPPGAAAGSGLAGSADAVTAPSGTVAPAAAPLVPTAATAPTSAATNDAAAPRTSAPRPPPAPASPPKPLTPPAVTTPPRASPAPKPAPTHDYGL